jgi:acyl-CoA thioesterase-1
MFSKAILFLCLIFPASGFAAKTDMHRVLILGDSLTEGLGVAKSEAYPAQLQDHLKKDGYVNVQILSAGISGSTSSSGLARLKWALKSTTFKPTDFVLELGANDGLRGRKNSETKKDLKDVIELAKANHLPVLLLGMKMPYNLEASYRDEYEKIFTSLAKEENISLMPFLLATVAGNPQLNQADGIHPTAIGHQKVADSVYPYLVKFLHL